jgi:hypothetical protein
VVSLLDERSGAPGVAPAPRPERPKRGGATRGVPVLVGVVVLGGLLRVLWASRYGLSFDETYTAMAGRRSVGGLFEYLRNADSHPPLDYLLRMPLARAGAGDLALRASSLVFSIGALALFARWMRSRGVTGVVATAIFAVSGFAIAYGAQARMYALLQLLGVAAAMTAEAWLRAPRPAHARIVGALVFLGCLDQASMFLLAAGLVAVAGLRTDRGAWRWRAGIAAGIAAWAVLWGPSMLAQLRGHHSNWIPPTSLRGVTDGVASLVTFTNGVLVLVAGAVVVGGILLARTDRTGFRVWLTCGMLPIALAAAVGVITPFFLNRTLTLMMWAPILAVGVAVGAAWSRARAIGLVAVALTALVVWPGTADLLDGTWEYDITIGRIEAVARPGDVIAVAPTWYEQLVDWRIGVRAPAGETRTVRIPGLPDAHALQIEGAPRTGRIILLEYGVSRPSLARFRRCAPTFTYGDSRIFCLERRE